MLELPLNSIYVSIQINTNTHRWVGEGSNCMWMWGLGLMTSSMKLRMILVLFFVSHSFTVEFLTQKKERVVGKEGSPHTTQV